MTPSQRTVGGRIRGVLGSVIWCGLGAEIAGGTAVFAARVATPPVGLLDLIGLATGAVALVAFVTASSAFVLERRRPAEAATPADDIATPTRSIPPEERGAWAEAVVLAVVASTTEPRAIELVRVGDHGAELLLAVPCPDSPPGFESLAEGRIWRVLAGIDLEDLRAMGSGCSTDLSPLDVLGSDGESDWFGRAEELAVFIEGEEILVEPFGLRLSRPTPFTEAATSTEPADTDSGASESESSDSDEEGQENRSGLGDLVIMPSVPLGPEVVISDPPRAHTPGPFDPGPFAPGPFEVRILRERPDLTGKLLSAPTPAAIEFVAYLATHHYRATTGRLRDSLGAGYRQRSRSGKTVWEAASAARRALGSELLPSATGNDLYRLDATVTCDWLRFQQLTAFATSPATGPEEARAGLTEALRLVEGVPAIGSRRFGFLDAEGILSDMTRHVVLAAERLVTLALEAGLADLADWARRKGELLDPHWVDEAAGRHPALR